MSTRVSERVKGNSGGGKGKARRKSWKRRTCERDKKNRTQDHRKNRCTSYLGDYAWRDRTVSSRSPPPPIHSYFGVDRLFLFLLLLHVFLFLLVHLHLFLFLLLLLHLFLLLLLLHLVLHLLLPLFCIFFAFPRKLLHYITLLSSLTSYNQGRGTRGLQERVEGNRNGERGRLEDNYTV